MSFQENKCFDIVHKYSSLGRNQAHEYDKPVLNKQIRNEKSENTHILKTRKLSS
jgi:hypothetical protein